MAIKFLCPNGHKIHCPEDQAGRAAKCPRCGVRFRIPELSEVEEHEGDSVDSDASQAQLSDSGEFPGVSASPGSAALGEEEEIEFLCPNGHRLHGPASLQGRPGQCPECGSRFRVPSYDEVPEGSEEDLDEQISLGGSGRNEPSADEAVRDGPTESHDLANLFLKLWPEKRRGAIIELHLADGHSIVPEHFAEGLSGGTHGVFAVADPDGTHTLTIVAWESITRVQVRRLKRLPDAASD